MVLEQYQGRVQPLIRIENYSRQERRNLRGEETPLAARIAATADAYTAMREPRPYREAMHQDDALDELHKESWTQFDGECVQALVDALAGRLDGLAPP